MSGVCVTVKYGNFFLLHSEVVGLMNNLEEDLPSVIAAAFSQASASVINAVSANAASTQHQTTRLSTTASVPQQQTSRQSSTPLARQQSPSSSVGFVFFYFQL